MPHVIDTVVVGAGFAGLFIATQLARDGRDVALVEASDRPGGVAATITEDGYVLEPAAGTFMVPHRALSPILDAAGVALEEAADAAALRYVWNGEDLIVIPYGPKALATRAISVGGKLRMATEPFVRTKPRSGEESLKSFLTRRLGREAGTLLSHVAASGVYAGDPNTLSAAAAFPLFTEMERDAGSITRGAIRKLRSLPKPRPPRPTSHVPVGGMSVAASTLADALGDRYVSSFPVSSIIEEDGSFRIEGPETLYAASVVVALRPETAAKILPKMDTDGLEGWPSSPVVVVGIGGTSDEVPLPEGFGFLTGPGVEATILGCLFESSFAPGTAAPGHALAKVIVGGARNPSIVDQSDDQIVSTIVAEMEAALGTAITPSWVKLVRNREGIPHYDLKHRERLTAVDNLESEYQGLIFAGWGYRGIGVAHLATEAAGISDRIE
jgi:oxygen-dependent protoporphyrinogen oxidase